MTKRTKYFTRYRTESNWMPKNTTFSLWYRTRQK